MLTLQFPQSTQDSDVVVRWCLSPELAEEVKDHAGDLFIGFCIAQKLGDGWYGGHRVQIRQVYPLDRMTAHLRFYAPGEHRIGAALYGSEENALKSSCFWLGSSSGEVNTLGRGVFLNVESTTTHDVVIPAGVFTEPSWLSDLVARLVGRELRDPCHMREMLALACATLVFKSIGVMLYYLFLLLYLPLLLVLGFWRMMWRQVLRPFGLGSWKPTEQPIGSNVYLTFLGWLFGFLFGPLFGTWDAWIEEWLAQTKDLREAEKARRRKELIESLSCEVPLDEAVSHLPLVPRAYIAFHNLKARVCKPYAQR